MCQGENKTKHGERTKSQFVEHTPRALFVELCGRNIDGRYVLIEFDEYNMIVTILLRAQYHHHQTQTKLAIMEL